MTDDIATLLLAHADPWVRRELAREIESQSDGTLDVIGVASEQDAYAAVDAMSSHGRYLAVAITDEKLVDDSGENLLRGLNKRYPGAARAILEPGSTSDSGVYVINGVPGSLRPDLAKLRSASHPPHPRVVVTGPRDTTEADNIAATFDRICTIPEWKVGEGPLSIKIDGVNRQLINPTPGEIFKALKLIGDPKYPEGHPYDLVIVGAGPAGLSAALNASVNVGLSTLIIESHNPGGIATTSINPIENYLGFPQGISGPELARLALKQVSNLDQVDFMPTLEAQSLKEGTHGRHLIEVLEVSNGKRMEVSAGMVLLACGQKHHKLKLAKGKDHYPYRGVYHSALPCEQEREKGKIIAIVGGGDSAGQAALQFSEKSEKVILLAREGFDRMSQRLREAVSMRRNIDTDYFGYEITEFIGELKLEAIKIKKKGDKASSPKDLKVSSTYILIGGDPDTAWIGPKALGQKVELNAKRHIKTDVHLKRRGGKLPFETSLDGVFAAGDVRVNSLRRVGQAVGQGAAAVASMERYAIKNPGILLDEDSAAHARFSALALTMPPSDACQNQPEGAD